MPTSLEEYPAAPLDPAESHGPHDHESGEAVLSLPFGLDEMVGVDPSLLSPFASEKSGNTNTTLITDKKGDVVGTKDDDPGSGD